MVTYIRDSEIVLDCEERWILHLFVLILIKDFVTTWNATRRSVVYARRWYRIMYNFILHAVQRFHSNAYRPIDRSAEISVNHDVSVTSLVIGCKHSRCENLLATHGAEYGMNLWLLDERLLSTVSRRTSQGRPMDNHVQRKRRTLITSYCYIIIFFVEMLA